MANEVKALNDAEISSTLFQESYRKISENIEAVMPAQFDTPDYITANDLKRNAATFSAFKSAHFSELLKGRSKSERAVILDIFERQLGVEANLASRVTRSAKQWKEFERTKALYPNLEYLSSRSADKRTEHAELVGTILPIDHPFWDSHLPPNDWGCKCRARKTDAEPTGTPNDLPKVPKGIPGNPGKEGVIFTPEHPFVRNMSESAKKRVKKQLEKEKLLMPYGKADVVLKNGSSINVHPYAKDDETQVNFEAALLVAKTFPKTNIFIRPHAENVLTGIGENKRSNPEYLINGVLGDLKRVYSLSEVENTVKKAMRQGNKIVIFKVMEGLKLSAVKDRILSELSINKNPFSSVFIIHENLAKKL